jgi:hypothetical protein
MQNSIVRINQVVNDAVIESQDYIVTDFNKFIRYYTHKQPDRETNKVIDGIGLRYYKLKNIEIMQLTDEYYHNLKLSLN